jgi:hypothetical protein
VFGRSFVFFASPSLSSEEMTRDEFWQAMPRLMAKREQWQVVERYIYIIIYIKG